MTNSSLNRFNNLFRVLVPISFVLIISLGGVSIQKTKNVKVSFYPLGEFHLEVRNEQGEPVEGAVLNVFEKNTKNLAFNFPIDNYHTENDLISNKQGMIIAVHIPHGLEIGRICHDVFWLYLVCSSYEPNFDFEISASGYQNIKFSTDVMFYNSDYANQSNGNVTLPLPHFKDKWLEVPIFKQIFILKDKNIFQN